MRYRFDRDRTETAFLD